MELTPSVERLLRIATTQVDSAKQQVSLASDLLNEVGIIVAALEEASLEMAVTDEDREEAVNDQLRGDPWRLAEWAMLPNECLIDGCTRTTIDQRGPVFLRDGSIHKACTEHWEGIMSVLGDQNRTGRETTG